MFAGLFFEIVQVGAKYEGITMGLAAPAGLFWLTTFAISCFSAAHCCIYPSAVFCEIILPPSAVLCEVIYPPSAVLRESICPTRTDFCNPICSPSADLCALAPAVAGISTSSSVLERSPSSSVPSAMSAPLSFLACLSRKLMNCGGRSRA